MRLYNEDGVGLGAQRSLPALTLYGFLPVTLFPLPSWEMGIAEQAAVLGSG